MIGRTLGPYEILALLGKGGMGEVYRARDTKLDREVAIKVLPEEFAKDEERLLRFQREAKLLAALDHPHIAAIHGFESVEQEGADPIHFLVLEYVEGESLAQRLENGPLNLDDALEVCEQIAQGLEAAHDKGIVHRDLKPQNVLLRSDGSVKVLDFGLARAMADSSTTRATSDSPTITADFTQPGVVLGTAAYMSPEQARGRSLDERTDIWSFGAVLYECLTGKVLFLGESATESMGAILHKEPEWPLLPADTPPMIQVLLRRCLAKDRKRRLRSIADAGLELREAIADPTSAAVGLATASLRGTESRTKRWAKSIGALVLVAAITTAVLLVALQPPEPFVQRYIISAPEGLLLEARSGNSFDVSQDGRVLVMVAGPEDGPDQLYVREADQLEPRLLPGTEEAAAPTLSPDAQSVVYSQNGVFKRMSLRGPPAIELTDGRNFRMTDWSEDGWIYFSSIQSRLFRVSENGGEPQRFEATEGMLRGGGPRVFPGGAILFATPPVLGTPSIIAIHPGASQSVTLVENGISPHWSPTGHLLFVRDGTLMAAPFDPIQLEVGPAVPMVPGVRTTGTGLAQFVITSSGTLYYMPGLASGGVDSDVALVHVAMDGSVNPLAVQEGSYVSWGRSPDEQRIALVISDGNTPSGEGSLEVLDVQRNVRTPLPAGPVVGAPLLWSPDGSWIYYIAANEGQRALYRIAVDGSGAGEPISGGERVVSPTSITADGKRLYGTRRGDGQDIVVIHLEESRVEDVIGGPGRQAQGVVSPDGAWLAYTVGRGPDAQVYISSADGQGGRVQVSRDNGRNPAWSPDGKKLYFNTGRSRMVADVTTPTDDEGGVVQAAGVTLSVQDLEISPPSELFEFDAIALAGGIELTSGGDGFLALLRGDPGEEPEDLFGEIIVVQNFFLELERLSAVENR